MAEEVQDLLVSIRSEGIDQVTEDLGEQREEFVNMADTADRQTQRLQDFASAWKGAMTVIVAGLAIGVAGLLSKVPILGELFSGLSAILRAVAFQLDERLRPILGPIRDRMFELADAITRGDWDMVRQIVTDFATAFTQIDWRGILSSAVSAIEDFLRGVGLLGQDQTLLEGFIGLASDIAGGLRDFLVEVIKKLPGGQLALEFGKTFVEGMGALVRIASEATTQLQKFLASLTWDNIVNTIALGFISAASTLTDGLVNLVKAVNWDEIVEAFKVRISDAIDRAISGRETISPRFRFSPSTSPNTGPLSPGDFEFSGRRRDSVSESQAEKALTALQNATVKFETNLDGRQVANATQPFIGEGAANAGRINRTR